MSAPRIKARAGIPKQTEEPSDVNKNGLILQGSAVTRTYLDHNATTPLNREAATAIADALPLFGNPSSVHDEGRRARKAIETARDAVARMAGATPDNVIFTSGATEANNAVMAAAMAADLPLFVSSVEHLSVLEPVEHYSNVVIVPVDAEGLVDLAKLETLLPPMEEEPGGKGPRFLASVMLANNETGVIQPVSEIAALVHERGGLLHCDAVQAAGKLPIDINALGADFLTFSAHKFGGPKGVGALIRRPDTPWPVPPFLSGGGQERRVRAGTENVLGIVGMGAAAAVIDERLASVPRMKAMRDRLEDAILRDCEDAVVFSRGTGRLANTTCFAVPGLSAETAVISCDLKGVSIGSGSACSSGKVAPSHVLEAMGAGAGFSASAVRVSLGPETDEADIDQFIAVWRDVYERLIERRDCAA